MPADEPADYSPNGYRIADDADVILTVAFVDEPDGYGARVVHAAVTPAQAVELLRRLADDIERDVMPRYHEQN